MAEFGVPLFGRELFGSGWETSLIQSSIDPYLYQLELWDTQKRVKVIEDWIAGEWITTKNMASELTFKMPLDLDTLDDFAFPNRICLTDSTSVLEWFYITRVTKNNSVDGPYIEVFCTGAIWSLGLETIVAETVMEDTVGNIIDSLLALQQNTKLRTISRGSISSVYSTALRKLVLEKTTILRGLLSLQEALGGWIWVDENYALNWQYEITGRKIQQIRLDKNLVDVELEEDHSTIRTKIIGYSSAESGLSSEAENNVATYGEIVEILNFDSVHDQDTLDALVAIEVAKRSVPYKVVDCNAIDLSYFVGELDYSHERLFVGNKIRLVDEILDVSIDTWITKVTRDLASPIAVKIEIGERPSFLDYVLDTEESIPPPFNDDIEDLILDELGIVPAPSGEEFDWEMDEGPLMEAILEAFRGGTVQIISSTNIIGESDEWSRVDHRHALPHGEDDPDDPEATVDLSEGPIDDNAPIYLMGDETDGFSLRIWGGSTLGWRKIWYLNSGVDAPEDAPDTETLNELPLYLQCNYGEPSILWKWKFPETDDEEDADTGEWVAQKEIIEVEETADLPEELNDGQASLGLVGKYGYIYDANAPSGEEKWTCFTHYLGTA